MRAKLRDFFCCEKKLPCFTAAGPGQLTINPSVYQRVLEEHEWPSVRRLKLKRIHDNDPKHHNVLKHTSESSKDGLKADKCMETPGRVESQPRAQSGWHAVGWLEADCTCEKKKKPLKGLVAERIVVNVPQAAMRDWWVVGAASHCSYFS